MPPDPTTFVGDLDIPRTTTGEDYIGTEEEEAETLANMKALRHNDTSAIYMQFLEAFLPCAFKKNDGPKKRSFTKEFLSDYCYEELEAFVVLAYLNGHAVWKALCGVMPPVGGDAVSSMSSGSPGQTGQYRFTGTSRGGGKYCGWSRDGVVFYNRTVELLEFQRKSPATGRDFDARFLRHLLEQSKSARGRNSGGSHRVKARNGLSKLRRATGATVTQRASV